MSRELTKRLGVTLLLSLDSSWLLRMETPSSWKLQSLPSSSSYKNPPQVDIVFMYTQCIRLMSYRRPQISKGMYGKRFEWLLERKNTYKITLMKGKTCIESRGSQRSIPFLQRGSFPQLRRKKCRDQKVNFGVSKFMGNLGFARRKLRGRLFSKYVRIGREFKEKVCVLQAFH